MNISLIVAASENNAIGKGGKLPWHLPDDLRRFKELTMGHPIIMGRKTHESIGRALPNRRNIVITRQKGLILEGCDVVGSLKEALNAAQTPQPLVEVFVIGGGEIYQQALPLANKIYFTRVHAEVNGDTFFPEISKDKWEQVDAERHEADSENPYAFTFLVYEKRT